MEAIYRTNVFAMAYTFHGFIEPMTKRGRGKLVGIARSPAFEAFPAAKPMAHPSPPSSPTTKPFASASGRRASRSRTISRLCEDAAHERQSLQDAFVLTPDEFAERAVKTIDSDASYRTIPGRWAFSRRPCALRPTALGQDRRQPQAEAPRLVDKQKAEAEAAQRKRARLNTMLIEPVHYKENDQRPSGCSTL